MERGFSRRRQAGLDTAISRAYHRSMDIVAEVIKAAGGPSALAKSLGVKRQAIYQWGRIPADRVITIERLLGGRITRHQMRPDLYPTDE